jgi:hypothetical protein
VLGLEIELYYHSVDVYSREVTAGDLTLQDIPLLRYVCTFKRSSGQSLKVLLYSIHYQPLHVVILDTRADLTQQLSCGQGIISS